MPARACSVNIRWATVSPYLPCCVREVDLSQLAKDPHYTHLSITDGCTGCAPNRKQSKFKCYGLISAIEHPSQVACYSVPRRKLPVTSVHLLWHVRNEDEKLIGVYATNADAVAAKERLRQQPGFVDTPEGFEIHEYELNQDHWTEGYVSV